MNETMTYLSHTKYLYSINDLFDLEVTFKNGSGYLHISFFTNRWDDPFDYNKLYHSG